MMFLWTQNNKIGSKLIQWGVGGPSHFAIAFDESPDGYGIVLHSHIHGVSLTWFNHFYDHNEVVYALAPKDRFTLDREESVYRAIVSNAYGRDYDKRALLYFGWRVLLKRSLGIQIPAVNPWNESEKYLCVELYDWLHQSNPQVFPKLENSSAITSPQNVYDAMRTSPYLTDVPWITQKRTLST